MSFSKILIFLILIVISGCGKNTISNVNDTSQQSSNLNESWFSVTLTVPPADYLGGARTITFNNKSYLIGSQTSPQIESYFYSLPQGRTFSFQIMGVISKETGNFPNPMAEFDVIHVTHVR